MSLIAYPSGAEAVLNRLDLTVARNVTRGPVRALSLALVLGVMAGCATDPAPHEQMRLAEQALEQAKSVGATDQQETLALAEEKLTRARMDLAAGQNREARMRAEQAELDARLAEAQVLTQKRDEQVQALQARIQRLRQQLEARP